ncbi:hypothetical protein [Akkermansia sp.]|uniref:hypothetical protein n=1 Tax=Akkermansia sp. TaxID=1872421 RepID=UPI003AB4536E
MMKVFKNKLLLSVVLRHPDKALHPNNSMPLSSRGAKIANQIKIDAKKKARGLAKLKAIEAGAKRLPMHPNAYRIYWFFQTGRGPDGDNCGAVCKAYMDGICQAIGMDDRHLEFLGVKVVRDRARTGYLAINFYDRILVDADRKDVSNEN